MKKSLFLSYCKDTSGQFAIWVALLGLPMTAGITLTLEHMSARDMSTNLSAALDAAALAAVLNQQLTEPQRRAFATQYFYDNFDDSDSFTLDVRDATSTRVELFAKGSLDTSVSGAFGIRKIAISDEVVAMKTEENVICVLTLNPNGEDSFLVEEGSDFFARDCSVQVNSVHPKAARVDHKSRAQAKSFCAHGGTSGLFTPYANSECRVVPDPLANLVPPAPLPCNGKGAVPESVGRIDPELDHADEHETVNNRRFHNHRHDHNGKWHTHNHKIAEHHVFGSHLTNPIIPFGANPADYAHIDDDGNGVSPMEASVGLDVEDQAILFPGTYCDGIKVNGDGVRFMPGQYDVYKGLYFKEGGQSIADDVVFIFHGDLTELKVEKDAKVRVSAPRVGKMAGIAFFHKPKTNRALPIGKNWLKGGGNLDVRGAVYFPYHTLEVGKGSHFESSALAASYISYNAHFTEDSSISIASDHERAGLPPLEPRSDSGARLMR